MTPLTICKLAGFGGQAPKAFTSSPVSLGTAPGSEVRFDPAWDRGVAPRHGIVEWTPAGWSYRDLGTAEGSWSNGQRLSGPVVIDGAVEISLGQNGPRIRLEAAAVAAAQGAAAVPRIPVSSPPGLPRRPSGGGSKKGLLIAAAALVAVGAAALWGVLLWKRSKSGNGAVPSWTDEEAGKGTSGGGGDRKPDKGGGKTPPAGGGEKRESFTARKLIVQWKKSATPEDRKRLGATYAATTVVSYKALAGGRMEVLDVPGGKTAKTLAGELQQSGLVEFAEPDGPLRAYATPNDPGFVKGLQWGLENRLPEGTASYAAAGLPAAAPAWKLQKGSSGGLKLDAAGGAAALASPVKSKSQGVDIAAPPGWDVTSNAGRVVVGVIDTGIRYTHEDLAPNLWRNPREIPGNGTDDDGNGFVDDVFGCNALLKNGDPMDDNGHGTHVAGIIGALGNNGFGVTGVAWNVQLMACRCLDANGSGSFTSVLDAMEYAATMGATILNLSLGGPEPSQALTVAMRHLNEAGIIVVVAAGNEGSNNDTSPRYPASCAVENMIVVGSVDPDGTPSDFSNFGAQSVHLFAPGRSIVSTFCGSDRDFHVLDGTSMATPFVTGALALLKAKAPYYERPSVLIQRLLSSARPLPSLQGKCATGGLLNLSTLMQAAK